MAIRWKCTGKDAKSWLSCSLPASFSLQYNVGARVKAPKGSMGIFTFKTRKQAEKFLNLTQTKDMATIKRVKVFGRGKRPKVIVRPKRECLKMLTVKGLASLLADDYHISREIFYGTLCYPEVEVLS